MLKILALFLVTLLVAAFQSAAPQPSREQWLDDYDQLLTAMASHYANLQWAVSGRHMDLKHLRDDTISRLQESKGIDDAHAAIQDFVDAFGDGHLNIDWADGRSISAPPADVCSSLGFGTQNLYRGVQWSLLPEYRSVSGASAYFPASLLKVRNRTITIVRIDLFSPQPYPDLCQRAIREVNLAATAECNDACGDRVDAAASDLLSAELRKSLRAVNRLHAGVLVVDITGNGGGTQWAEVAARMLSRQSLKSQRYAVVRSPHWVTEFDRRIAAIRSVLLQVPPKYTALYGRALAAYSAARAAVARTCDMRPVWDDRPVDCSNIYAMDLYTTGIVPDAGGEFADLPAASEIFRPSAYRFDRGVYRGKLIVLVSHGTGSAAERFAAMFQDNRAAVIIGMPTHGSGCGYTNGGIPTVLLYSGAHVEMPDCVQIRADGSDAVSGVTPDILVPWHDNDSPYQRAARVRDMLNAAH